MGNNGFSGCEKIWAVLAGFIFTVIMTATLNVSGSSTDESNSTKPIFEHCLKARGNLIFVVERSRKSNYKIFLRLKDAMESFMNPFNVGRQIRVSVRTFEYKGVQRRSPPRKKLSQSDLMTLIDRLPPRQPQNLVLAVGNVDSVLRSVSTEDHNVVVYLWSNARAADVESIRNVLKRERDFHSTATFVLGLDSETYQDNHQAPTVDVTKVKDNVFIVHNYDDIPRAATEILKRICPACDLGWTRYGNSCYRLFIPKQEDRVANLRGWWGIKWLTAKTRCEDRRSHLVSVHSTWEYIFLVNRFIKRFQKTDDFRVTRSQNMSFIAIGLKRADSSKRLYRGNFQWEDGKPMTWVKWDRKCNQIRQPDGPKIEECIAWKLGRRKTCGWHDIGCGDPIIGAFICEKPVTNLTVIRDTPRLPSVTRTKETLAKLSATFQCENGEYITSSIVCDGVRDCSDGSDEMSCGTECTKTQFQCSNGRCISLNFYCNFHDDCFDNSDEQNCGPKSCGNGMFHCANGQCIDHSKRCDLQDDCGDHSDEHDCDVCNGFWCFDGECIPRAWTCDGVSDCHVQTNSKFGEDEIQRLACPRKLTNKRRQEIFDGAAKIYFKNATSPLTGMDSKWTGGYRCHLVPDGFGKYRGPKNMSHVNFCGKMPACYEGFFRCNSRSYCIAPSLVCNGVFDCIGGEDEMHCEHFSCPGYFRCDNVCIRLQEVCDGVRHCSNGYDELFCDQDDFCPPGCSCSGRIIQCKGLKKMDEKWIFHPDTRYIDFSTVSLADVSLKFIPNITENMFWLARLNLSHSNLGAVPSGLMLHNLLSLDLSHNQIAVVRNETFKFLTNLRFLNLSHNADLRLIESIAFVGLERLEHLDLSGTRLKRLTSNVFEPLSMLNFLNLSDCRLDVVEPRTFTGLGTLKFLDIRGNPIKTFYRGLFKGLDAVGKLYSPSKTLCCSALWEGKSLPVDGCIAPEDSISSCEDLLQKNAFRVFLWLFSIMALGGNVIVIAYRLFFDASSVGCSFGVFVTNLAFSDFFMGLYMLIICIADTNYRGTYLFHERNWRTSFFCHTAGFMSTLSCIGSSTFVCLITVDRYLIVRFPFKQVRFSPRITIVISAIVWSIMVATVMVPFIPPMNQWNLFGQNGVCLALPLSVDRGPGWLFSTSLFIGFNFVAFLFSAIGQIAIYKTMTSISVIQDKKRNAQERKVAQKLSLIVLTNFVCWFPVCVMGLAAMNGLEIDGQIYAWIAVFVLPINSALNPFIYTIPVLFQKKLKKETSTFHSDVTLVSKSVDDDLVYTGDPEPGMKPMRGLIKNGMLSANQVQWLCGSIISALPSLDIDPATKRPIKIFVKMTGNMPSSICLTFDEDEKADLENAIEIGIKSMLHKTASV